MDVSPVSRAERRRQAAARQRQRHQTATAIAAPYGGAATRAMLRGAGLTYEAIRAETEAGRWVRGGRHTVGIHPGWLDGQGAWWRAVWESGAQAVLDGQVALVAGGLKHWAVDVIDVSVPNNVRARPLPGVRIHQVRRVGAATDIPIPRTRPFVAAVRAAQWARTDRQAATVLAMTVQQGLATGAQVMTQWSTVHASPRSALIDQVIHDVCDGAHSLGELDFAVLCRHRGLPEPSRQALRVGAKGRVYLDVWFDDYGVHVEIHGAQHGWGLAVVDDTLRANVVAITEGISIQVPVLGLRLKPDAYLDQVEAALMEGARRRAAG